MTEPKQVRTGQLKFDPVGLSADRLVFYDTETTGLDEDRDEIWEIGSLSVDLTDWTVKTDVVHVMHHRARVALMPEKFRLDHDKRYGRLTGVPVLSKAEAGFHVNRLFAGHKVHLIGCSPEFDTVRTRALLRAADSRGGVNLPWHYHLQDLEQLVAGFLRAKALFGAVGLTERKYLLQLTSYLPQQSDEMSRALGVEPDDFDRHTALGDCEWAWAQWQVMFRPGLPISL